MDRKHPIIIGPIGAISIYKNDVVVKRRGTKKPVTIPPSRGEVAYLSRKSLRRLTFVAQNTAVKFVSMVTLTYPKKFPLSGKTVKRHLNAFLAAMRYHWQPLDYIWWLEFQKRGAPHIHLLTAVNLAGWQQWISERWYGIVGSQDTKHLAAGTNCEALRSVDGAARYITAYASKPEQKTIPKIFRDVGRWWGHSRAVAPQPIASIRTNERGLYTILHAIGYDKTDKALDNGWSCLWNVSQDILDWLPRVNGEIKGNA